MLHASSSRTAGDACADATRPGHVARDVLELDDPGAEESQGSVDRSRQRADLLREPHVVPADELGNDALDESQARIARRDRDHRVDDDEILGPLERGVEIVAHLGRREAVEQPVEVSLEPRRVLARGAARPDLGFDLGRELLHVDVVVGQPVSPRLTARPDSIPAFGATPGTAPLAGSEAVDRTLTTESVKGWLYRADMTAFS